MSTRAPDPESHPFLPLQVLTLEQLFSLKKFPSGQVALHVTDAEWTRMVGEPTRSRIRPRPGMIGIIPIPIPSGGILALLQCISDDPANRVCVPVMRNVPGSGIEFGPCRCFGGPHGGGSGGPLELQKCTYRFSFATGKFECVRAGCKGECILTYVLAPPGRGNSFVTCKCAG